MIIIVKDRLYWKFFSKSRYHLLKQINADRGFKFKAKKIPPKLSSLYFGVNHFFSLKLKSLVGMKTFFKSRIRPNSHHFHSWSKIGFEQISTVVGNRLHRIELANIYIHPNVPIDLIDLTFNVCLVLLFYDIRFFNFYSQIAKKWKTMFCSFTWIQI